MDLLITGLVQAGAVMVNILCDLRRKWAGK